MSIPEYNDAQQSTDFWERNPHAAQNVQWVTDPYIAAAVVRRISRGQSAGHWLDWLFNQHFDKRSFKRILSIGCGVGDHEIVLAHFPQVEAIDAFDFSEASIAIAKGKAQAAQISKINFFVENFNTIVLEPQQYDLILCTGSLHHVRNLEHLLGQVRQALLPNGVFIANEYVGACYNIYGEDQLSIINQVLTGLPTSLQAYPGESLRNPTIEQVFARDPTEAVRSKLIPDFLRIYFKNVDERPYGGALLHPLFPFINIARLMESAELHQALINNLILLDTQLMQAGKSDFSFFICSKAAI